MSLLNLTLFSFWSQPLNILIFLPLLGALIASFTKGEKKLRMVMIGTSAVTFLYSLQVWRLFSLNPAQKFIAELGESFADPFGFKLGYLAPWFPEIGMGNGPGVSWYLGIDGISLSLIVLTTFVSISAAISSNSINKRLQLYVILFLLLETSLLGVLVARDDGKPTDRFSFFVAGRRQTMGTSEQPIHPRPTYGDQSGKLEHELHPLPHHRASAQAQQGRAAISVTDRRPRHLM